MADRVSPGDTDPPAPPGRPQALPSPVRQQPEALPTAEQSVEPAKAGKVMHSVPGDALTSLREIAGRTGLTNTDIVLECLVRHAAAIQAEQADSEELTALERRVRAGGRRKRERTGQLTLYLTAEERAEVDEIARAAGMNRSQLVTEALDRGLGDIE